MLRRTLTMLALIQALAASALGCGSGEEAPAPTAAPAAAPTPAHAGHAAVPADAPPLPAIPEGGTIVFVDPKPGIPLEGPLTDGKVPVRVVMGTKVMQVMPAGEVVAGAGHHHLIIDGQPVPAGEVVPADATHIHFGGGQTETDVALTPGEHTLTLQFADGLHRSYGPALSATITVNAVAPTGGDPAAPAPTDK